MKITLVPVVFILFVLCSCKDTVQNNKAQDHNKTSTIEKLKENSSKTPTTIETSNKVADSEVKDIKSINDKPHNSKSDTFRLEDFKNKLQQGKMAAVYNAEDHYAPSEFHIYNNKKFVKSVDLSQLEQFNFRRAVNTKDGSYAHFNKDSLDHLLEYFSEKEIALARPWETNNYKYNFISESIELKGGNLVYKTYIGIGDAPQNAEGVHPANCKVIITSFNSDGKLLYKNKVLPISNPNISPNANYVFEVFSAQGYDSSSECINVYDILNGKKIFEKCSGTEYGLNDHGWIDNKSLFFSFRNHQKDINGKESKKYVFNILSKKLDSIRTQKDYLFFSKGNWYHQEKGTQPELLIINQ